jgi:hypothetical protein
MDNPVLLKQNPMEHTRDAESLQETLGLPACLCPPELPYSSYQREEFGRQYNVRGRKKTSMGQGHVR